jgi:hypothetical protein
MSPMKADDSEGTTVAGMVELDPTSSSPSDKSRTNRWPRRLIFDGDGVVLEQPPQ